MYSVTVPIGQRPNTLLDSSKSVNTSPAATVICQRSSKLQDVYCLYSLLPGKLEVIILITLLNSVGTDSPMHKSTRGIWKVLSMAS